MTIYVNSKPVVTDAENLAALHRQLDLPAMVAIAVNNTVVPRDKWAEQALNEGDTLVIIRVACGG